MKESKGLTITQIVSGLVLAAVVTVIILLITGVISIGGSNSSNSSDSSDPSNSAVHPRLYSYECKTDDNDVWLACIPEECNIKCNMNSLDTCEDDYCTISGGKCVPKCGATTVTKLPVPISSEEYSAQTGKKVGALYNCCGGYTAKNADERLKSQELCNIYDDDYMDCVVKNNLWTGIDKCVYPPKCV